jgi:hypothetical protein
MGKDDPPPPPPPREVETRVFPERFHKLSLSGFVFVSANGSWSVWGDVETGVYSVLHCKQDLIDLFPEIKLCGLVPNFHIHVTVSDLYIPTIGPPIFLQQNRQTDQGNI